MPQRVTSPTFIGREPELAALLDALERAAEGRFSATFVAGESGVGKSRLLNEFEREAERRGTRMLGGECVRLTEGELPYAPIRSALRRLQRELGAGHEALDRLLAQLGADAAPAPEAAPGNEPFAQARMFDLLLDVLTALAEQTPVALVIEDVHWADHSTLDLLAFLLANARREPLLLVCSYRTDELHRRHPLRAFLAQHERPPVVQRVELHPFTRGELTAQLQAILGELPDDLLVSRLHARTEGNAFFTEELLAASPDGTALPASLREALMLRVDGLAPAAQHIVRLVATHGRPASHGLLAAASGMTETELHDALREAIANQVLVQRDDGSYALRHSLFGESLDADLLPGERRALHLALAEAIEGEPALVDADGRASADLSAHWLAAHRLPEALAATVQAAAEAEQVYAFAEAADHLRRALDLWHRVEQPQKITGTDEAALYARAAEAAQLSSDGATGIRLVSAAIDLVDPSGDPYRAAMLRQQLGHYLFVFQGDTEAAQGLHQEALDLLPADEPRRELARVLATLARVLMLRARTAESIERCEQALAVARQAGARAEEAHALNTLGVNLAFLGDRKGGIERLRESLRMCEELGDADGISRAYTNLGETLDQDGRIEDAAQLALEGAQRVAEIGFRDRAPLLQGEAATRLFMLGRLDEAERLTRSGLDLRPSLAKLDQCAVRARVEIQRGRLAEAAELVAAAGEATARAPGATWIEPLASARVELELLRDCPDKALNAAVEVLVQSGDHEYVPFTARLHALGARAAAQLAERARAAGDEAAATQSAQRAQRLLERLDSLVAPDSHPRGTPPPAALAYRELCAAEASRAAGTATTQSWAAIAARMGQGRMRLEQAYAHLREAECHLLEGDRAQAGAALARGQTIAAECGARWLADQLDALGRRGRLAPVAATDDAREDRFALTERELAVLELVAAGLTNREIGERLFMAPKTASVHVSRILTKLGVSSRVEAATSAQRLGLVP